MKLNIKIEGQEKTIFLIKLLLNFSEIFLLLVFNFYTILQYMKMNHKLRIAGEE